MINNYISYFYHCFKADNRETGILNFFSSKYEHQLIIKSEEELSNKKYPLQYISKEKALPILQTIELFKNDKELWYGSLFCLGKRTNFSKRNTTIAAPLLIYKATIEQKEEDYFLKINHNTKQLNIAFLKGLLFKTSFYDFQVDIELLFETNTNMDFYVVSRLKHILEKHISNLHFETDFLLYPKLKNKAFLKTVLKQKKESENFTVVSSSGIFISSRVNNINAVVNELEILKNQADYSQGLHAFFSSGVNEISNHNKNIKIPQLLNSAQERIVRNASKYNKSVIFGPPGTGKTYTINAIAQDYISKGKSVLIVTKTSQALDVISNKLMHSKINNFTIKVGGNYYKRKLLAKLNKIIKGTYYRYNHKEEAYEADIKREIQFNKVKALEIDFEEKVTKEIERVENLFSESFYKKTLSKVDINFIRVFEKIEWEIIENYFKELTLFEKRAGEALLKKLISNIVFYSNTELQKLITLKNIIQTEDKSLINKNLQKLDVETLTHFLPVWLVKIDEIASCLPMQKDVFDVAIVDEATQCDIASCLPIFQRAKKIIVAGDTNQLRHLSFLSDKQMNVFQKQHQITDPIRFNFRKKSLLDFTIEHAAKGDQIVLLNEHYRSLPEIIQFSNDFFYGSTLRIMTHKPENRNKKSVFLHKTNGLQDKKGVNSEEISQLIKQIQTIVKKEHSLNKNFATSIGVLSPFRQQINALTQAIKIEFDLNIIKKHSIKIGTPYHFQGEERDIMLLSIAVNSHSHFASLNYLNKKDVFNVAITRARNEQHVFYSLDTKTLSEKSLLKQYLSCFEQKKLPKSQNELLEDTFSKEIKAFLIQFQTTIHIGYAIAGLNIDILVEKNNKYLGIDLIGYPGSFVTAFDIERYRILYRVGIQIIPISYLSWTYHKEETKRFIKEKINAFS